MLFRIDEELALKQASIFVAGAALLAATILLVRDYHVLERYRYLIATVGILLLMAPRLPGIGSQVNGAYLGIDLGPLSFQPAEVAKICVVIFLASYLREKRELLAVAARRVAGLTIPPLKHFGPAAGGLGRLDADARLHPRPRQLADVLRRLPGPALRRHGALLLRGRRPGAVLRRRLGDASTRSPTSASASTSGWTRGHSKAPSGRARSSSRCSPRPTAACSAQGLGESLLKLPGPFAPHCAQPFPDCGSILPAPHTDEIYAVIVSELGLFGGAGAGGRSTR